ncbi:MAG: DUF3050 domain-containing protein [Flavobacteriales bacterium]|nr:DUF3050 domain-containing protein [Flavobacteriales bacterium]
MTEVETIKEEIEPLREQLLNHPVYHSLDTLDDLNVFLEHHIFAVWDFMSLLKALQRELTCISIPWTPKGNPSTRKLINEIVLGEETDQDENGLPISHFELYIEAMAESRADTAEINKLIELIRSGQDLRTSLLQLSIPTSVKEFILFSFDVIETHEPHKIAAAFTFGREDLIPDMFGSLVAGLNAKFPGKLNKLIYYLDRHIELDADVHGPMAMQMIAELCGNNSAKWNDCVEISKLALQKRLDLWDGILEAMENSKMVATL